MPDPKLTEEQIEAIAERAAQKAVAALTDHVYREIGKGIVSKLYTVVGVCAAAVVLWATSKGWIKP